SNGNFAVLQGRWAHLTRHESWLTEAQALGIDGHFAVEQGARAWNALMMNFNGTAGVWRRAALEDPQVGGWSADTLTEDLVLSYRAQLAGWKIEYCFDLAAPAELPNTIEALKSQQRRWATGSMQVARKLLPRIWVSRMSLGRKLEATFHLTHYSVSFWMLILALVARPVAYATLGKEVSQPAIGVGWLAILLATFAPSFVYAYARYALGEKWSGLRTIPSMLVLGCGMCINNSLAVVRGLFLRGGEFVRTPKSGSVTGGARRSSYQTSCSRLWIAELVLGVYTLFTFVEYLAMEHRMISLFMLIYAAGFLTTGFISMPRRKRAADALSSFSAPKPPVEPAAGS
ncbi:MAG: glycosyltransferase, partial [Planctomycetes bacterium]|nr:glycosyltransferase [Planctomycetota bacterium]